MQNLLSKLDLTEDKLQAKLLCRNLLTPKQFAVMQHIAVGESAKVIGDKLGISRFTVHNHIRCLRSTLGAHNVAHAVSLLGL